MVNNLIAAPRATELGQLSGEIIEELYVAEVLAALDHCFGVVALNLEAQMLDHSNASQDEHLIVSNGGDRLHSSPSQ